MVLALLVRFAEAQREAIDVHGFLAVDAARLDRLRQELVDAIGGLMVDAGVALLERPLELLGDLVLCVRACVLYGIECNVMDMETYSVRKVMRQTADRYESDEDGCEALDNWLVQSDTTDDTKCIQIAIADLEDNGNGR